MVALFSLVPEQNVRLKKPVVGGPFEKKWVNSKVICQQNYSLVI
jgi:hypothetical protein